MDLDLTPSVLNLRLYAGDDAVITLHFTDTDGNAADVSGDQLAAQVRDEPDDPLVVCDANVDATNAATGDVTVWFKASDTTLLAADACHYWDLQRTYSGATETLVSGMIRTVEDVTRL